MLTSLSHIDIVMSIMRYQARLNRLLILFSVSCTENLVVPLILLLNGHELSNQAAARALKRRL